MPGWISGAWVAAIPQRVDGGCHQAQDAARTLEALQAGPIVEAREQSRMERVGAAQAVHIRFPAALGGEDAVRRRRVQVAVGLAGPFGRRGVAQRAEQAAPHDRAVLARAHRTQNRLQAPEDAFQALQRLAACPLPTSVSAAGIAATTCCAARAAPPR